ncbi:alpha/beta-Hydrolase [Glarea lozoyensis ATCC 20868]|uniref:Alpha/beta-Hydrolase n=1 Tax=Glarea lozoyensis (strain ATCC 20868 / MF5171) TaxID=1116229 RepID=S3D0R1_GLAL2|nr:alpha/beta-Hydrolase [Glarea lozoyensis ATCC 20868]EPE32117.1 alpha/beta-Hydrolase [Glarea lozoyensis ATCC 20868]
MRSLTPISRRLLSCSRVQRQDTALFRITARSIPSAAIMTEASPRKLKILMLHGFTQSGPLFRAKTRALEKLLIKAFPPSKPSTSPSTKPSTPPNPYPGGVTLIYPTGPIRLQPADIPGFSVSDASGDAREAWAWWVKSNFSAASHPGVEEKDVEYSGLAEGLGVIRDCIKDNGGVDGVIGFSQGGCASLFVASLLNPGRAAAFRAQNKSGSDALKFLEGWEDLQRFQEEKVGGLKFAVSYSGFYAPSSLYSAFYSPPISTPSLHFVGSLDSVVEESRVLGLVERCEEGTRRVVYHPGGHFVPIGKEMAGVLVGFVRECVMPKVVEEEGVEGMDVPF